MKFLIVIPARRGSKGIPGKNIKQLNGKPLICYSIDVARKLANDEDICVSTDDDEIRRVVEDYGLKTPFVRPSGLATDNATTNDVLIHALGFYEQLGLKYDGIILLQPTSPLRTFEQVLEAKSSFTREVDMVVSVKVSHAAAVICKENPDGFLALALNENGTNRQNISNYYEYNGAIYIINTSALKKVSLQGFTKIVKYVMPESDSIDIDSHLDWQICEGLLALKSLDKLQR
jgi:CMP-N,N'-diacetyllegionaminic acid synthase